MTDAADPAREWARVRIESRGDYRIFQTRIDHCASPVDGHVHPFVVIDAPDWVNVLALTDDDTWVLVRQFRFGTRTTTLELPGGAVDRGEDLVAAGARELLEETGYAGDAKLIGVVAPNPAILSNRCGTVLVTGARRVAEPKPDPNELIEVVTMPRADADAALRDGRIDHALVVAAFQWWHLHRTASA